ncbi:MAG: Mur ligase domain-containing protein [Cytophagales bacterium]|nr:Mur ligase domain-containing protein [Cytophagales bacterium]
MQKVHLIAIGGSVMHNLALALQSKGIEVSGSDDSIFEPSRSRLEACGLLPGEPGWFPEKIHSGLDAVILGMHAKKDNPELLKAKELGIRIYSFPEFIRTQTENKQRIVIGGSHGKTTISAMLVHILSHAGKSFDFVVGAQLPDFDIMVKLTDAPVIIIEGDEYLSSATDPIPKFLHYGHHIAVITGIAWDHANVFPTFEQYKKQFELFADATPKAGTLIYHDEPETKAIGKKDRADVASISYQAHPHLVKDEKYFLKSDYGEIPLLIFGEHNMQNIAAAKEVCKQLSISDMEFYEAVQSFSGARKRLEPVFESEKISIYKDFAHAPSKVRASVNAMKSLNPSKPLVCVLELHTFSSLDRTFILEYKKTMDRADYPIVFIDNEVVLSKGKEPLSENLVREAFGSPDIQIIFETAELESALEAIDLPKYNLLVMSSGNLGGFKLENFASQVS